MRSQTEARVDTEATVCPVQHVLREPLVQELALQEEGDHSLTVATAHLLEIHIGDVDEPALGVEASLEEQAVPVGVPPTEGSRRLEYNERGATDGLSGGFRGEVAHQGVDEATDLAVQPLVVAEEDAQHLGKREDELAVRQPQQQLLVHVLAQQQGTLLRTGGTKSVRWPDQGMEHAAAEGPKVFQSAVRVGTLDPGHTSAVVTAGEEPLHSPGDPLEAELSEAFCELGLVAGDELREVGTEEPLERTHSPLAVAAGGRRIQRESQLVCHMKIRRERKSVATSPRSWRPAGSSSSRCPGASRIHSPDRCGCRRMSSRVRKHGATAAKKRRTAGVRGIHS